MELTDQMNDMEMCHKCSACKFVPLETIKGYDHINSCPSITRYNYQAYSGGGRIAVALAMLDKRIEYSKNLLDMVYNCQVCGACDVSCKYAMDMEVLEHLHQFRIRCVENGQSKPALDRLMIYLREQNSMVGKTSLGRADWANGLNVKDITEQRSEVVYHAGCRVTFDKAMWKNARATVKLLQKVGVDIGIVGKAESCCGGRAYEMGYKANFLSQAKHNLENLQKSGAKILITGCAECYAAFKVLYDRFGMKICPEVLHTTEYLDRLLKSGALKPMKEITQKVTYHDPCHLGRLGEPWQHWEGKRVPGHMYRFDPPKPYRRGTNGVYESPRNIIRSIPGIQLVEMDRTREYAWCCGAGGGVKETNPQFAKWTAAARIEEARATGAEAIVTACPGCQKNLTSAVKDSGSNIPIYDAVELLMRAL
jgi:Fe-S oxidoreductase